MISLRTGRYPHVLLGIQESQMCGFCYIALYRARMGETQKQAVACRQLFPLLHRRFLSFALGFQAETPKGRPAFSSRFVKPNNGKNGWSSPAGNFPGGRDYQSHQRFTVQKMLLETGLSHRGLSRLPEQLGLARLRSVRHYVAEAGTSASQDKMDLMRCADRYLEGSLSCLKFHRDEKELPMPCPDRPQRMGSLS